MFTNINRDRLLAEIDADSRVCCIISPPCCIPPGAESQIQALADIIWAGSGLAGPDSKLSDTPSWALNAARALHERLGFVPHGADEPALLIGALYSNALERTKSRTRIAQPDDSDI